jgi:uncharacterized protein
MNLRTILLASLLILGTCSIPISATVEPGVVYQGSVNLTYRNTTVYAPAVAQTDTGEVGVISTITVTVQSNGTGRVFVDTLPLTDVDMQGSARLAVKVATGLVKNDNRTHLDPAACDYFFVVRTQSSTIGGPSAGAIMTVATIALLENWTLDNKTVMTGMIDPDGSIGPIGGIPFKIDAAHSVGATHFLIPKGQMTYTDTVTETIGGNGWTQIITHPVTRNVSDYASTNYGMTVTEVEDINDAIQAFTGWRFPTPTTNNKITTTDYQTIMRPIATSLLNQTETAYHNASHAFNTTTIPNRWPTYYRNQITDNLNAAQERLIEARDWYTNTSYYTVLSKTFQSLVDSTTVQTACQLFTATNQTTYLQSLTTQTVAYYHTRTNELLSVPIQGLVSLQCVGAAQQRAAEAQTYLTAANTSQQTGDILTTLYNLAFAHQRSDSIHWWLTINAAFNDTGTINQTAVTTMANDYIDNAQQAIAYSQVLLQEMGQTSQYLTDAQNDLQTAQTAQTDNHSAAALFESFQALTKANLAIELVDGLTDVKLQRAQTRANAHITQDRNLGLEPVLAVSYYEYAQSLQNESSQDTAIIYYKYSDLIAGALQYTAPYATQTSRYLGIPPTPTILLSTWTMLTPNLGLFIIIAGIGALAGLGIGLLLGVLLMRKDKPPHGPTPYQPEQPTQPYSINDYYTQNK